MTLGDLAAAVRDSRARTLDHLHLGLPEIARAAGGGELFDSLLVFENYPADAAISAADTGRLTVTALTVTDATHYPVTLAVEPGDRMRLRLGYNGGRVTEAAASTLLARLGQLLGEAPARTGATLRQLGAVGRRTAADDAARRVCLAGRAPVAASSAGLTRPSRSRSKPSGRRAALPWWRASSG